MARSLKKNYVFNSAYQIVNIIVPLITTPYLSRTIGATGNGLFTYTQSVASMFTLFAQLGITNYGVREIATCGEDRETRSRVFWEIFCMNLTTGAIVTLVYALYCVTIGRAYAPLSGIWALMVVGSTLDVTWLLNGCQEFKVPMMRSCCTRLAGMVFILLFVRNEADVWAYVFAIAAPYMVNALWIWVFVRRYVEFSQPSWSGMLSHLKPNLLLFIPVVAVSVYSLLDSFMLGSLGDMEATGLYNYSSRVIQIPMALITALSAVVLPRMTEILSAGKVAEAKGLVGETMWFMEAAAMAFSWGVVAVAPEFVPVFFGDGYAECVILIGVLAPTIPLISASNVTGIQYLVPYHRDKGYTASIVVGAVVNFTLNLWAIPNLGAVGASLSTVAAEVAVLIVQFWLVRGDLSLGHYLAGALPFLGIGAIMYTVVRGASVALGRLSTGVLGLFIEFLVGAATYLLLSIVWVRVTHNSNFRSVFPKAARVLRV